MERAKFYLCAPFNHFNSNLIHYLCLVDRETFFICCQRRDSNSLLSVHKPTTLVTQNVILIGSVSSEKNLFKYVGGLS